MFKEIDKIRTYFHNFDLIASNKKSILFIAGAGMDYRFVRALNLSNEIFGKVNRTDTGMKILLLDGAKLYKTINYMPRIKISDVYDRY